MPDALHDGRRGATNYWRRGARKGDQGGSPRATTGSNPKSQLAHLRKASVLLYAGTTLARTQTLNIQSLPCP